MHKSADTVMPVLTSRRLYRVVDGGKKLRRENKRRTGTDFIYCVAYINISYTRKYYVYKCVNITMWKIRAIKEKENKENYNRNLLKAIVKCA